jgi:hypothetical protein
MYWYPYATFFLLHPPRHVHDGGTVVADDHQRILSDSPPGGWSGTVTHADGRGAPAHHL